MTPDELQFCFDLLDHYAGEESKRVHWLADQWTSYGQDLSEAEWAKLEDEAAEVIALWRMPALARKSGTAVDHAMKNMGELV